MTTLTAITNLVKYVVTVSFPDQPDSGGLCGAVPLLEGTPSKWSQPSDDVGRRELNLVGN